MTDPKQAIEELRPIVEAAVRYVAAGTNYDGSRAAVEEWNAAQREWHGLPSNGVEVVARFAPLLTACEEQGRRLALAEAEQTWDAFWRAYFDFTDGSVLVEQSPESMVEKFREESKEFLDDPSDKEAIDCMAVLMFWAHRRGQDADLLALAYERLAVWRQRTWVRMDNGAYRHSNHETD